MDLLIFKCVFILLTVPSVLNWSERPTDYYYKMPPITDTIQGFDEQGNGDGESFELEFMPPSPDYDANYYQGLGFEQQTESTKVPPNDPESQAPVTDIDEALFRFRSVLTELLIKDWSMNSLQNDVFKVNFMEATETGSLNGLITFDKASFIFYPSFETVDKPEKTVKGNVIEVNFKYRIVRQAFNSNFIVEISSKKMTGNFLSAFKNVPMGAVLRVTKEEDGSCKYEGNIDIGRSAYYAAEVNTVQGFDDQDLTKKAEIILNTFVLEDLTFPATTVYDKLYDQVNKLISEKAGEKFRNAIKKDLCDFSNHSL